MMLPPEPYHPTLVWVLYSIQGVESSMLPSMSFTLPITFAMWEALLYSRVLPVTMAPSGLVMRMFPRPSKSCVWGSYSASSQ